MLICFGTHLAKQIFKASATRQYNCFLPLWHNFQVKHHKKPKHDKLEGTGQWIWALLLMQYSPVIVRYWCDFFVTPKNCMKYIPEGSLFFLNSHLWTRPKGLNCSYVYGFLFSFFFIFLQTFPVCYFHPTFTTHKWKQSICQANAGLAWQSLLYVLWHWQVLFLWAAAKGFWWFNFLVLQDGSSHHILVTHLTNDFHFSFYIRIKRI